MVDKASISGRFAKRYSELEGSRRDQLQELHSAMLPSISLVKTLREELSLSQSDLAETLGISQPSVSQLEARRDLKVSVLSRIVAAHGGRVRIVVDFDDGRSVELNT